MLALGTSKGGPDLHPVRMGAGSPQPPCGSVEPQSLPRPQRALGPWRGEVGCGDVWVVGMWDVGRGRLPAVTTRWRAKEPLCGLS